MKYTFGQGFGIMWGLFGLINFLTVFCVESSEMVLGFSFMLNSIIFFIPALLLYYNCKRN